MNIMENEEVVIGLSKVKITLLTLGAIGFVVLGVWLWSNADAQNRYNPNLFKAISLASIAFFGMCSAYGFFKIFDSKPGLILNHEGLYDNSSTVSGHFIKWSDITRLDVEQVQKTKFILIYVSKPNDYLAQANRFKRFWLRANDKMYGTPVSISATSLQCDFDELLELIERRMENHAAQHSS